MNRRDMLKRFGSGAVLGGIHPSGLLLDCARRGTHFSDWNIVAPGVWKSTCGKPEVRTPVRSRQISSRLHELRRLPAPNQPPLNGPIGAETARGVELQLDLEPNELMYGFGLQFLSFQQRSKKRTIRVNADPRVDSGDSHAPVPFYVTTRGYGVLVDTFRYATFYCGEARPRPTQAPPSGRSQVNSAETVHASNR